MKMTDDQRRDLAVRVQAERSRRFGTKAAAYQAAGMNAITWDRLEAGDPLRPDKLAAAIRTLWPATDGDWTKVPSPDPDQGASQPGVTFEMRVAALERRVAALERHAGLAQREERGSSGDTAPNTDPDQLTPQAWDAAADRMRNDPQYRMGEREIVEALGPRPAAGEAGSAGSGNGAGRRRA